MDVKVTDDYIELTVACGDCGQTGLHYKGFTGSKGVAITCRTCKGTGGRILRFEPYTGRKPLERIHRVEVANNIWFIPEKLQTISYEEFQSMVPQTPQVESW